MPRLTSDVFVGRREELTRLERAVETARGSAPGSAAAGATGSIPGSAPASERGSASDVDLAPAIPVPSLIFIGGEAGVGKTRLIDEFARRARARGCRVMAGGCVDLGGEPLPFAPIVEALRRLCRELPAETLEATVGPGRAELARLLPELAPIAAGSDATAPFASSQSRLFEAILSLLARLATDDPAILIVEDLHWADQSTLDLVSFLVRNLYGSVVFVGTYRTDELHRRHPLVPFLAEAMRSGRVDRIVVDRFDRQEVAEQVEAILERRPEPEFVDHVFERTGGNAFFTEELIAAGAAPDSLPETLRDVLLARVAELSDDAQQLLRVAAVARREVPVALLAGVLDFGDRQLDDALREAVARQILVPREGSGDERYGFRHALVQESIYSELLPGERTRLHLTCARALGADPRVATDPSLAAELGHHWYAAHDLPRALQASVAAGMAAKTVLAYPEALAQFERALELWTQVADPEQLIGLDLPGLLENAGVAAFMSGRPQSVGHIRAAIDLVDEKADPARAGLLYERLGRFDYAEGRGQRAIDDYRRAVELVPAEPPSEGRAQALAGLGRVLVLAGQVDEAARMCREAIELSRAIGAKAIEGSALNSLGIAIAYWGDTDLAVDNMRRAIDLAIETQTLDELGRAYNNLADTLNVAGRAVEAEQVAREAYQDLERRTFARFAGGHPLTALSDSLAWQGRWAEALEIVARVESYPMGRVGLIAARASKMDVLTRRGEFAEARALLEIMRKHAENAIDPQYVELLGSLTAEIEVWQGHPEKGVAAIATAATKMPMERGFAPFVGRASWHAALAAAEVRETERVRGRVALLGGAGNEGPAPDLDEFVRNATAWMSGALERSRGRNLERVIVMYDALFHGELGRYEGAPDPEPWARAAAIADELTNPYLRAYALWREAEAWLERGGREGRSAAERALGVAFAIARELGAAPLAAEVEDLGRRARLDLTAAVLAAGPVAVAPGTAGTSGPVGAGPGGSGGEQGARREAHEPSDARDAREAAERYGLTPREMEVLRLVADGLTNREIGERLFISEKTAGVHISNIMGKLDVRSRREAAAVARRLGLLEAAGQRG